MIEKPRFRVRLIVGLLPVLFATGCATSGNTDYACPAPGGGACMSVTDIYTATNTADHVDAPATKNDGAATAPDGPVVTGIVVDVVGGPTPTPTIQDPTPIREPARVMRIWVAPWEDQAGNLMVSGYVYTEVEARRWAIGGESMDARSQPSLRPLQVERRQPGRARNKEDPFIDK